MPPLEPLLPDSQPVEEVIDTMDSQEMAQPVLPDSQPPLMSPGESQPTTVPGGVPSHKVVAPAPTPKAPQIADEVEPGPNDSASQAPETSGTSGRDPNYFKLLGLVGSILSSEFPGA